MINPWRWRPRAMKKKAKRNTKRQAARSVLRLPDLEVAKSAVRTSPSCPDAQRGYRHAIDEFVEWYCSEPRLSFSKTVVLRYRIGLEQANYGSSTNVRDQVAYKGPLRPFGPGTVPVETVRVIRPNHVSGLSRINVLQCRKRCTGQQKGSPFCPATI